MRIDVTVTSTPETFPQNYCGGEPCVPLYPLGGTPMVAYPPDVAKDQFGIVDIGVETVVIDVAAPTDKFDEFSRRRRRFWTP
jgi:hypothetical protein